MVKVRKVGIGAAHKFQFLLGIIDKGAEVAYFLFAKRIAEEFLDLAANVTRGIAQHVLKGFVLTVQVGQEMLGGLGQMQNGLKVDDFGGHT